MTTEHTKRSHGLGSQQSISNGYPSGLEGISLSGQWFLSFEKILNVGKPSSEFKLKRGYMTVHKTFNHIFSARFTQDIAVDREGDGEGDIEIRLKYGYLRCAFNNFVSLTQPQVEFGLVHRPWIDFEESINQYRVQGTMFLERHDMVRSADYGITLMSLLGGTMSTEYAKQINRHYPGRFGSLAFGVYNGGGYEAIERNQNKIIEGRITL